MGYMQIFVEFDIGDRAAVIFKFARYKVQTYKKRPLERLVRIWYRALASSVLLACLI